jgi:hypothetical protein
VCLIFVRVRVVREEHRERGVCSRTPLSLVGARPRGRTRTGVGVSCSPTVSDDTCEAACACRVMRARHSSANSELVSCTGTKHKQDRPGGSWGVKQHHTTHHQLPLNPYCRVCARLGVVFVELYISPARAVNPQTRNATAVDQVHCRVSYVDSQQIGSVVRPRQERRRHY